MDGQVPDRFQERMVFCSIRLRRLQCVVQNELCFNLKQLQAQHKIRQADRETSSHNSGCFLIDALVRITAEIPGLSVVPQRTVHS